MTGFLPLIAFLAAFLAVHTAISRPFLRQPLIAKLGQRGYGILHGVVSVLGIALVFWAFFRAPYLQLWPPLPSLRMVPALLMPLACILAVASVTNPYAGLGGDKLPVDGNPAPGILSVTRHPAPWALVLWSGAHVVANGDVAGVLFFGTMLVFAGLAPPLVDSRRRRLCGEVAWNRFAAATSTTPFLSVLRGRATIDWVGIGWKPVLVGLAIYIALILLHGPIIGVPAVAH